MGGHLPSLTTAVAADGYGPDWNMAERLADAASVPLAYFYADDDQLATVILKFASLSRRAQRALVQSLS
jgi:hypothetical protein